MAELHEFEVRLSNGQKGTVLRTSRFLDKREFNTVKLGNGTELKVPSANLEPQPDGSFLLRDGQSNGGAQPESRTETRPESRAENRGESRTENRVERRAESRPENGAESRPQPVSETRSTVDPSLFKEEIDVQRVPVNRVIDAPVETRVEDGVTIIPVMEERLKIEKQLILREEIRIVKKRTTVRDERLVSMGNDPADVVSRG